MMPSVSGRSRSFRVRRKRHVVDEPVCRLWFDDDASLIRLLIESLRELVRSSMLGALATDALRAAREARASPAFGHKGSRSSAKSAADDPAHRTLARLALPAPVNGAISPAFERSATSTPNNRQ